MKKFLVPLLVLVLLLASVTTAFANKGGNLSGVCIFNGIDNVDLYTPQGVLLYENIWVSGAYLHNEYYIPENGEPWKCSIKAYPGDLWFYYIVYLHNQFTS
jgi:hypothetical protein